MIFGAVYQPAAPAVRARVSRFGGGPRSYW